MKIEWNRDRCVGHAQCVVAAPELWDVDDDGYAVTRTDFAVPPGLEGKARASADACPECAITIVDA
jgi:ferredoxin